MVVEVLACRTGCGACCIAPGITRPFFGMPQGKPPGTPCVHLDAQRRCGLYQDVRRPAVCRTFKPHVDVCGDSAEQALELLNYLESASRPETSL
ncbi:MAG: YkgJ family cysteine cluster protein [Luminiphilus sp.]|nr:YkgJ family cysteine cluster protein [Luminiphilus sp.]MDG1461640.1 YkgJ family cysteine cluster protein [Luminiphilus sp.]